MPTLEISIPTTSTEPNPSPHTVYHLTLRLPLRTFTLTKRYSEFVTLHAQLTSEASNTAPPAPLPPKTYLAATLKNPVSFLISSKSAPKDAAQIESRRQGLEAYLRAINDAPDPRWRHCPSWRAFLNLPASVTGSVRTTENGDISAASSATTLHATATAPKEPISDPVAWLDAHRELKATLHAARAAIASRDGSASNEPQSPMLSSFSGPADVSTSTSTTPAAAHEAAAQAKKQLVRANTLLTPLEQGLKEHGTEWSRNRLGEGEVRRRKDLLAAARHEIQSLESLLALVRRKGDVDGMVEGLRHNTASADEAKHALFADAQRGKTGGVGKGRVLGRETAQTRELDNQGVLALQQQMFKDQDEDLATLEQAVRRQRELGELINAELTEQNEMLDLLDEDVERVGGKLGVARKRVGKIS